MILVVAEQHGKLHRASWEAVAFAQELAGDQPRYAASGHLLFLSEDGTLMAGLFDPGAAELLGRDPQAREPDLGQAHMRTHHRP